MDYESENRCDVLENGICVLHNVEVERRKSEISGITSSITALKEAVAGLNDIIKGIQKTVYGFIGTTIFIAMVITGSFIYTREVGDRSDTQNTALQEGQRDLTRQVAQLAVNIARNEGMQGALITEIREFTRIMKERDRDNNE
jgi:hypothetical protein